MKQLNTQQIRAALKHEPNFLNVYALDQLLHLALPQDTTEIKLVANLQPSNLPGNHWIAIYRRPSDGRGYYFDSFGRSPPIAIQRWLTIHCNNWTFNNLCIQSRNNTVLCGYLCIKFLKLV